MGRVRGRWDLKDRRSKSEYSNEVVGGLFSVSSFWNHSVLCAETDVSLWKTDSIGRMNGKLYLNARGTVETCDREGVSE